MCQCGCRPKVAPAGLRVMAQKYFQRKGLATVSGLKSCSSAFTCRGFIALSLYTPRKPLPASNHGAFTGTRSGLSTANKQPWSSGRITACHAVDPSSILGGCSFLLFDVVTLFSRSRTVVSLFRGRHRSLGLPRRCEALCKLPALALVWRVTYLLDIFAVVSLYGSTHD